MKILLISSYLPYPLLNGGNVRLYNLIKELSSQHEITLICEKRSHQTSEDIAAVQKICTKVITVDRKKQWSIKNILQSGASFHSFLVTGHTNAEMQAKIREEVHKGSFDLIHVETFYVLQNVPKTNIPIVLVEHNIEYHVYQRFVDRAPRVLRPLLHIDIAKIKREEESAWKRATVLVAVSQEDKKVMEQAGFTATIVSNGVNTAQFSFREKNENDTKKILFLGDFSWIQNRDSVKFIIDEIWPKIKGADKDITLWIVGRKIPASIRSLTNDSMVFFDEKSSAKPTPEIFQEADILLSPIRVGGGTSYKILESMSCGTPVVTMPLSANAIFARDSEHLMIGQTVDALAEKTKELVQNPQLYRYVSKGGRALIEKDFTWKAIAQVLDKVYHDTRITS